MQRTGGALDRTGGALYMTGVEFAEDQRCIAEDW